MVSALTSVLIIFATTLNAEIITKNVTFITDTGPYAGTTGNGSFTYDDANIIADIDGGYRITRADGLTIQVTVFGQTYTEDDERGVGVEDTTVPAILFNDNYDILGIDFAVSEIAVEEDGLTSTVVDIEQADVSGFSFTTNLTLEQDSSYSGGMVIELITNPDDFPWEFFIPAIQHGARQK
jgi:hypothetical protein